MQLPTHDNSTFVCSSNQACFLHLHICQLQHIFRFFSMSQNSPKNVAVIGAVPAGLVAARELQREGHIVVVFERENQLGGTWIYTPHTDSDPIGIDPNRRIVHSSLYSSLRVNLPREVMGFHDRGHEKTQQRPETVSGSQGSVGLFE